ncbi:MAG TPA: SDR family NAD(P)-dependent oxidoreductase, partial [Dehalococcoidia bacterium]|nr:SDR family NAD(P)-dependent oxidoreductase [Dehalococcoidia bacterium]
MAARMEGKVAIVTGASRGIGKAIAEGFAREGAKVAFCARTLHEGEHQLAGSLDQTLAEIRSAGGTAIAVQCDVSDYEACTRMVEETRRELGPIDVLVNNAALNYFIPFAEYPVNRWVRSFAVDVHAPFWLSQLVLPDMIARKSGAIVNISSRGGMFPGPGPYQPGFRGGVMYGAAKAALERMTQGIAQEVFEHNIAVNALSPDRGVATPGVLFHKLLESEDDPRGEPMEYMVEAAILLATRDASYTGHIT